MVIGPLISVLLFSTALISTVAYLRIEEVDREREAVNRDSNFVLQNIKLRVMDRIAQITRIGDDVYRTRDLEEFQFQSAVLTSQFPELLGVALLDSESGLRSLYVSAQASASQLRPPTSMLRSINPDDIGIIWRERQAVFGPPVAPRPIIGTDLGAYTVLAYVPIFDGLKLVQVMVAEFNIDSLLYFSLPRELVSRYAILMVDGSGNALAGQWSETPSRLRELLPCHRS